LNNQVVLLKSVWW